MALDKNGKDLGIGDAVVFQGSTATVLQVVNGPDPDTGAVLIEIDGAERRVDAKDVERA